MSDLTMKAWHIENLIEQEPDAQVVLLVEAQEAIRKIEQERDRLLISMCRLEDELETIRINGDY